MSHFASSWTGSTHLSDVVVLQDDDVWKDHQAAHKIASTTGSFSFVRDFDDTVIDISSLESLPSVNNVLYLDDTWYSDAHESEIQADLAAKSEIERFSLLSAWRTQKVFTPWTRAKKKMAAARREATVTEKRQYAQQFQKAKQDEYISWSEENDVYELVNMREQKVPNFVTGRWVLTVKRNKDGSFQKCKARWVLRGFLDKQVWQIQTDSPTSTRPGFRLQCQMAANLREFACELTSS